MLFLDTSRFCPVSRVSISAAFCVYVYCQCSFKKPRDLTFGRCTPQRKTISQFRHINYQLVRYKRLLVHSSISSRVFYWTTGSMKFCMHNFLIRQGYAVLISSLPFRQLISYISVTADSPKLYSMGAKLWSFDFVQFRQANSPHKLLQLTSW